MHVNRKKQLSLILIIVTVAVLLVLATGGAAARNNPRVIPPHAKAFGQPYGEWSVDWWHWAFSLPDDGTHPIVEEGNIDCNLGQEGKVWFLAGAPGEWEIGVNEVDRICTEPIPPGTALFFPVVNGVCNTFDGDQIWAGSLDNCANIITDEFLIPISAKVDDLEVENLVAYRTISAEFDFETVEPPLWYPSGEVYQGVSGGYFLLLPPLSAGEHDIWFEGAMVVPPDVDWTTRVHYHFVVGK